MLSPVCALLCAAHYCVLPQLKERRGGITRIAPDGCSAICKGLFKKESDISFFEGARVVTGRGEQGVIQVSWV